MRHLWLLALCFTVAACSESPPADGAVRVLVTYGSYVPVCLRITATDGQEAHTGQIDIPQEKILEPEKEPLKVRAAVYRKPEWGRELTITVASMDAVEGDSRCSGNVIETLSTPEPIVVPLKDFATFTATLQARDDDHDGHVLKTQDVAGTDCDDKKATVHPGLPEACSGNVDYDCDGLAGCEDTECAEQPCDDGNKCTLGDMCAAGIGEKPQCRGTPKTCTPPDLICYTSQSACEPDTGECLYTPLAADVLCEDSNACTQTGRCNGMGECKAEPLPDCVPPNECYISERLDCPGSAVCTPRVKEGQACTDGSKPGWCRSEGICSVFRFNPSNFNPVDIDARDRDLDVLISCGTPTDPVIFDSTSTTWIPPQGCTLPQMPVAKVLSQGDERLAVLPMQSLTIQEGKALKLIGSLPVVLAVYGDATLDGALLADADWEKPGAGGNRQTCGAQAGENGSFVAGSTDRGSGGGGGGFGQLGAAGGKAALMTPGGRAGSSVSSVLVPLVGGCQGGAGGARTGTGNGGTGGAGGGAIQLAVAGILKVNHWISVSGGGGRGGKGSSSSEENAEGGGGGGSGGGLLLEADQLQITSVARLIANGGGGAEGGDSHDNKNGAHGNDGFIDSTAPAPTGDGNGFGAPGGSGGAETAPAVVGSDGVSVNGGGDGGAGGGGGGTGVIVLRGYTRCEIELSCDVADGTECNISPKVTPDCP